MKREFGGDLEKLAKMAFRRVERCGALLKDFKRNQRRIDSHSASNLIWRTYDWLCAPLSLWPIDFEGLASHLIETINHGYKIDSEILRLLDLVGPPPDSETQDIVAAFEHVVESGNYDRLVRTPEKFAENEMALSCNQELARAWSQIKQTWDVTSFKNSRGVIRRRLSQERNLRGEWKFDWADEQKKFQLFFDAMCYRWKLYGMEHDKPLLLKVSVNPTPHGTMIVIPRHLSLDPGRDLDWEKIGKLHRAFKPRRQGRKLSSTRMVTQKEALDTKKFYDEGKRNGLRGGKRFEYVCGKLGKDPLSDDSWYMRNLRRAKKLLAMT